MPRKTAPARVIAEDAEDRSQEDYCSVKRLRGGKVYECSRCWYTSERRSNVGRHFRRIHCELKRHKRCICDEVFLTKGEYYEHCVKKHPHLRHASFITSEKYKIGKYKSRARSSSKKRKFNQAEMRELRSSRRIAACVDNKCAKLMQLEKSDSSSMEKLESVQVSVEKNNNDTDGCSPLPVVVQAMDIVEVHYPNELTQEAKMNVRVPQPVHCKRMDIIINDDVKLLEPSADKENNQLRLPPKKRYRSSTVFSDITNNNNSNRCSNQFNKTSKIVSKCNNNAIRFIDQIDFDDLDAILSLAHMKHLY